MKVIEANKDIEVEPNRVNCYVCPGCSHITKTIDLDVGVTSFLIPCEKCGEMARSQFYHDLIPSIAPTMEWIRPSLQKVLKKRKDSGLMEHILQGGLSLRTIVKQEKHGE